MQSKRVKVKVPGLYVARGLSSFLWQSAEFFNSMQREHDGRWPMGFKRINIEVTASRGASWGTALHCGEVKMKKNKIQNNLNAVYHIRNNRHAHKQKFVFFVKETLLRSELVPKQKPLRYLWLKKR